MSKRTLFTTFILLMIIFLLIKSTSKSNAFIAEVDRKPTPFGEICADLNSHELWRIGDDADGLVKNIAKTTIVAVDEQTLSSQQLDVKSTLDLHAVSDPFGFRILLGSHNSRISFCFDSSGFAMGTHTASLTTTTTLNETYIFSWVFTIG